MENNKKEITAVAAYANLSPETAELLLRYLLEVATQQEKDAVHKWQDERIANEQLFDLLLLNSRDGVCDANIKFLQNLTRKEPIKRSRLKMWLGSIALVLFIVFGYFIFLYLQRKQVNAYVGPEFVTEIIYAGDATKVVWLDPDSTRVELQPHSKLGYSKDTYSLERKVQVWGSASFDIAPSKAGLFKVKSGALWISLPQGAFTLRGN